MQLTAFFKMLKVKHYVKNLIIILPLMFAMKSSNPNLWFAEGIMTVSFCLISSAVYIMNDLIDLKKDKLHPIKSKRPIASGAISKTMALFTFVLLLLLSLFFAYQLNFACIIIILSYFVLNIFYSFLFKKFAIIDFACIAVGFILRIVAGCYAINVLPSPFVILMTFFVSMFFTCMKRKLEIQLLDNIENGRESIREFDLSTINQFILINAILSISFYFTYTLDAATIERAGTRYLYITSLPFTLIMYRLFLLINTKQINDDPIHYLEQDKTLKMLFILYLIVLILVLTIVK